MIRQVARSYIKIVIFLDACRNRMAINQKTITFIFLNYGTFPNIARGKFIAMKRYMHAKNLSFQLISKLEPLKLLWRVICKTECPQKIPSYSPQTPTLYKSDLDLSRIFHLLLGFWIIR